MTKRLLVNRTCSNKAVLLNAVPGLQHHHAVPSDHHHPNLVLRFLEGLRVNYLKRKKLHINDEGLHANHGWAKLLTYLLGELNRVVQNQIHEGVKAAEGAFNLKKRFVFNSFLT